MEDRILKKSIIIVFSFFVFTFNLSSSPIALKAEQWNGKFYKKGVNAQCADFVGYIFKLSGKKPPANYQKCTNWLSWGKSVNINDLKKGDVIVYSKNSYGYNHIGIYIGNRKIIHRPTKYRAVTTLNYNYRSIIGIRRAK